MPHAALLRLTIGRRSIPLSHLTMLGWDTRDHALISRDSKRRLALFLSHGQNARFVPTCITRSCRSSKYNGSLALRASRGRASRVLLNVENNDTEGVCRPQEHCGMEFIIFLSLADESFSWRSPADWYFLFFRTRLRVRNGRILQTRERYKQDRRSRKRDRVKLRDAAWFCAKSRDINEKHRLLNVIWQ